MDKYAYDEKEYQCYTQSNSDNRRELFKEIAGQADSENGLTQVTDEFSDKFSAGLVYNYHLFTFITVNKTCQGESAPALFPLPWWEGLGEGEIEKSRQGGL